MSDKNFKLLELYFVLLLSALKNHPIPARAVGVVLHEQSAYHKSNFRFLKNNLFKRPDMDFYDLSEQEINVISTEEFLKFFFPAGIPWKDKNQ